ncbi:hypothetical protein K474DRAFT_1668654 [Panus rudis PR-1116 ss-1]|nr:hypothetical protein K474DRAFT_1668654 [Panus rudis PR-1116 ss-1]
MKAGNKLSRWPTHGPCILNLVIVPRPPAGKSRWQYNECYSHLRVLADLWHSKPTRKYIHLSIAKRTTTFDSEGNDSASPAGGVQCKYNVCSIYHFESGPLRLLEHVLSIELFSLLYKFITYPTFTICLCCLRLRFFRGISDKLVTEEHHGTKGLSLQELKQCGIF